MQSRRVRGQREYAPYIFVTEVILFISLLEYIQKTHNNLRAQFPSNIDPPYYNWVISLSFQC
jgi:hypothetical protein